MSVKQNFRISRHFSWSVQGRTLDLATKASTMGLCLFFANCSSEEDGDDIANTGGSVTAGGGTSSGGATSGGASSGGAMNSGGLTGVGGVATGGAQMSAGGTGTGGGNAAGGHASGGADGSGGDEGTGGEGTGGSEGSGGSPAVTCPSSPAPAGDTNRTVVVDGQERSYVLHVPASNSGADPVPFIIDFHGITGNGPGERSSSPYPAQTDPEGVVMAFPTGAAGPIGNAWNVGPCCVDSVDDVEFARKMVEDVAAVTCIDPKRIYAVGFSMGGGMSHYLACHAADLFAAVAPAAFDLLEENVTDCQPSRPITVVSFRGTSDSVVSYDGGYSSVVPGMPITFLGAQDTFTKWAEISQCTGAAEDVGGGCSTYSSCQDDVTVTLCTKQGGGHDAGDASFAWPILKENILP